MKINGISSLDANQSSKASFAAGKSDASFATELAAAKAGETAPAKTVSSKTSRADFASMTGKQLFDWASSKVNAGDISQDDSFSLQSMAIVIQPGKSIAIDDKSKVNFTQQAQASMEWAKSNGEKDLASMMEANLAVMRKYQVS